MSDKPALGTIGWVDLTVRDADGLRDFYAAVTGWRTEGVDMGGHEDHNMLAADGTPVAGICHDRGSNAGLPAAWLVYITVSDLDNSLAQCTARGGEILHGPKNMGQDRYAVIRDPAGAVSALYEQNSHSR